MSTEPQDASHRQARWARFRFSVVGPLLAAPPKEGELGQALEALAKKQWKHPITEHPVSFSVATFPPWFSQNSG